MYLDGEDGESLEEQEESLLMTFYSMYSALEGGDHGFDKIMDDILNSLRNEDDEDEETASGGGTRSSERFWVT